MGRLNDEESEATLGSDYTDDAPASSSEDTGDPIVDKIERTRTELLDLSLRNPLLNYRPLRSRGVEVVDEIPAAVFDFLVHKARPMSFLARQDEDQQVSLDLSSSSGEEPSDELDQPEEDENGLAPQHTDSRLQTNESASQLQSRLLKTHHAVNTLIQEQGVNTLFVALGMVEWYPSNASNIVRQAPLILVPVEITRSDVRGRFRIAYTGGELGANLSFMEKVKNDFGVDIPGLPSDEDLDVDGYFDEVASRIEELDRWSVDRGSVVLGFFSFGKFLMYRDLDPTTWPDGIGYGPRESGIIRALFGGGFSEPDPKIGEGDRLDDHLSPEDIHHVVDADSSQALAIFDVNQGRNLVIQGPPGTGKSQTIMNIIAEAIGNDRKVLFVSEKMAALEVVKHRLDGIGLGVACLELHSHKTTKRTVLDELKKTLDLGAPTVDGIEDDFVGLARLRSRLNAYAEAVNAPVGKTGVSPYVAYGKLIRIRDQGEGTPLPRVDIATIGSWAGADFESKLMVVSEFQTRLARVGVPEQHPFWGSRLRILLPNGQAILKERIDSAVESLGTAARNVRDLADPLGLSTPKDLSYTDTLLAVALRATKAPDIVGVDLSAFEQPSQRKVLNDLVDAGKRWGTLHSAYDDILEPSAWNADVRNTHGILSHVGRKFQACVQPEFFLAPNNPSISREWIDAGLKSLKTLTELVHQLAEALGLSPPEDATQVAGLMPVAERAAKAPDIRGVDLPAFEQQSQRGTMERLADAGRSWDGLHSQYDDLLDPGAWNADVRETHDALSTVGRRPWRFLSPRYRRAQRHLSELCLTARPDSIEDRIATVDAILQEQERRRTFERLSPVAGAVLGTKWEGQDSDWDAIGRIVEWTLALFTDVDSGTVAIDSVKALRDDIDAREIEGLLREVAKATDSHAERIEALSSIIALDIEGEARLLDLSFAKQSEILDALGKENNDLAQANVSLSALFRAKPPVGVERQIEVLDGILEEQELRRTFDSMSPVAEAALGEKWKGADSDWTVIGRIVDWALALFTDVDGGVIPIDATRSLRDDINPEVVGRLTDEVKAAVDSHIKRLDALQTFLEMDNSKRFKDSARVSLTNAGGAQLEGMITLPFAAQGEILAGWSVGIDGIHDLVGFNSAAHEAAKEGLQSLVEVGAQWSEAADHLTSVFERAWYEHVLSHALTERSALASFDGNIHEQLIGQFCSMDELALDHNRTRVAHSHWSELPKYEGGGQLRTLRWQFGRKRGHLPIRQLMLQAGNAIQAIKPVFMMSPMSIATYLPPGSVNFDLVVFDEASQVRPVDALGALMRADQSVVVGDSKQLPPTRFFDIITQSDDDDEDDSAVADMESILGLFTAEGAPDRMLRWHYRSRYESLIAVSNREFYENGLVVFPSPDSSRESIGLRYHHLPETQYDRGRSSTNRKEAAAVAAHVMEHARRSPELTLGVAAFSSAQREAVQDELERLRRQDPSCETFFNDHPEEPFFVKNLENVQGDERDVIFISIGYGRDSGGRVAMNFGPLTSEGGERRLNVLITRAKRRCHVFTNLRAADIDLNRTTSRGVRALKTFLAYAETGVLEDVAGESGREIDSPFQRAVATKLRSRGYDIHEEVATGGKFIDLAVVDPEHPGRYLLGIECDGASYHSSRSARDRDRLREQHLRNLDWRLHRIWSTDWFHNPERELNRAVEAIEQVKAATPTVRQTQNKNRPHIERVDGVGVVSVLTAQRYELAQPYVDIGYYELHEAPGSLLFGPITEIVRVEGPVHVSEVQRRIADAVGVTRIGSRIKQNLGWAIGNAERRGMILSRGEFLWSTGMNTPVVRDRGAVRGKRIEMVAPEEIAQALRMIVKHSYGVDRREAAIEAARLLGFRSVSKNTAKQTLKVLDNLVESGEFVATGAQITVANQHEFITSG